MSKQSSQMEWVARGPTCFGKARSKVEAIKAMADYLPRMEDDDEYRIDLVKVEGFKGVDMQGGITADDFHAEYVKKLSGAELKKLERLVNDTELQASKLCNIIVDEGEVRQVE